MLFYHFVVQEDKSGLHCVTVEVSRSHTMDTHATLGSSPLKEWSAGRKGRYLHNKQTQKTNIQWDWNRRSQQSCSRRPTP